jgi:ring-1,2-phenylacetyl-CoA epoxidase subunit PaaB
VFIQPEAGAPHQHAGSVHAADAEMALQNARDVFGRRGPVANLWVVPASAILTSKLDLEEKPYRHVEFYKGPR